MSPAVDWPNGWQGGRVVGHDAERDDGSIEVSVHQVVRDRNGTILDVADVRHVYSFDGDTVRRMDLEA